MAVPLMPQWMVCGDGVPVGAFDETVSVAVTTVVGNSDGVELAVAIGVSVVTMTSVGEVEVEVEVATSIGVSVGSMTSDVIVAVEDSPGTMTVVSVGGMMMDVTVGPPDDVGSSAVVEAGTDETFANEEVGMGKMLNSGVEVMLAKVVKFPGMPTEEVGMGVGVTSGVLILGNDVKFVGTSTVVVETELVRLTKVGEPVPSVPKGAVEVVKLEMGK